jgi:hypothetical protein
VIEPRRSRGVGLDLAAQRRHVHAQVVDALDGGGAPDRHEQLLVGEQLAGVADELR